MQIAMVAVLAASVAAAALIDRHRHEMLKVSLGDPVACGSIFLRLPAGADVTESSREPGLLTAVISHSFPTERQVSVTVTSSASSGLIDRLLGAKQPDRTETNVPFGKSGDHGQLYAWGAMMHDGRYEMLAVKVIATARLGSGIDVTIRSETAGASHDVQTQLEADIAMVKDIAASVEKREETAAFD